MEYKLNKTAFMAGYLSKRGGLVDAFKSLPKHLSAGGGGFRDTLWNNAGTALDLGIKDVLNSNVVKPRIENASYEAGNIAGPKALNGAIDGTISSVKNQLGWDSGKGIMDNIGGVIQKHPIGAAIGGAGLLGAGYLGGKALGLFGGSNQNTQPGTNGLDATKQPVVNNGLNEEAYTPGYAPKAIQKMGMPLTLPIGDVGVPRVFNLPLAVGSGMFKAIDALGPEEGVGAAEAPKQFNISPGNNSAKELLKDPKMQQYVKNLVQTTYQ